MSHMVVSSKKNSESVNSNINSSLELLHKKIHDVSEKLSINVQNIEVKSVFLEEKVNNIENKQVVQPEQEVKIIKEVNNIKEELKISEKGLGSNLVIDADGVIKELTSSVMFKENIQPICNYKNIYKLEGRQYNYVGEHPEDDLSYGFLAEEVALVDDSLVIYKDGVPYSLQYNEFIPLIVECVKDHNEQLLALEAFVAKLENNMGNDKKELNDKIEKLGEIISHMDKRLEEHANKPKPKSDMSFITIMIYIVFFLQLVQFAIIYK